MKSEWKAAILVAAGFSMWGTQAFAQNILNQSKDDLLKDFDIGKTLTAPPGPQFSGTQNPPAPASWAPKNQTGTAAPGVSQNAGTHAGQGAALQGAAQQGGTSQSGVQQGFTPQGLNTPVTNPPALLGNYSQDPSINPPQKRLLQRIIEGAMNAVNVSNTDGNGTHVKVPFVDVNVGGPEGVKVKAPFVKYNCDDGAQVKAPFVKYNSADGAQVKAPFVKVNSPSTNQGSSLK
ncbi:MAG: hypothetical protein DKT66_11720 [Candidatus Melainabacteria bacterium]|nr:MAG: hypothetical protein DKT66_11720 [Candidatus Melainabacteria bacterium]